MSQQHQSSTSLQAQRMPGRAGNARHTPIQAAQLGEVGTIILSRPSYIPFMDVLTVTKFFDRKQRPECISQYKSLFSRLPSQPFLPTWTLKYQRMPRADFCYRLPSLVQSTEAGNRFSFFLEIFAQQVIVCPPSVPRTLPNANHFVLIKPWLKSGVLTTHVVPMQDLCPTGLSLWALVTPPAQAQDLSDQRTRPSVGAVCGTLVEGPGLRTNTCKGPQSQLGQDLGAEAGCCWDLGTQEGCDRGAIHLIMCLHGQYGY